MHPATIEQIWQYLEPQLVSIGIIILSAIIGYGAYLVFGRLMRRFFRDNRSRAAILYRRYWHKPMSMVFILIAIFSLHPLLIFSNITFEYYYHIISLLVIALFSWMVILSAYTVRDIAVDTSAMWARKDNLDARRLYTKLNLLVRIISIIVAILGISFALMTFPKIRQVGISILASAGIATAVVGFAGQKILGNFLAGIQIAFTQPIRIGDEIIVANEWGVVDDITLSYVVIKVWDKRRIIVPINYFIENIFQNWTHAPTDLIGTVFFTVDYTAPLDAIRQELDRVLLETELWDGQVKLLQVTDSKPEAMELRILASALTASRVWDLRCYVREKIIAFLQKNYPHSLPRTRIEIKDMR
jgi:small-conductance mechanosensitive channel